MSNENLTPAAELRAAASKIRSICAGVQATPWTEDDGDMSWQLRGGVVGEFQLIKAPKKGSTQAEYWPNRAERQHILLWQPDMALLVADWLEVVGDDMDLDYAEVVQHPEWIGYDEDMRWAVKGLRGLESEAWKSALIVARAINGGA